MPDRKSRWWAKAQANQSTVAPAGDAKFNLLSDYEAEVGISETRGVTIGTFIGEIGLIRDGDPSTVNTLEKYGLGIGVMTAGLTSTLPPVPGNDSFNWMWYLELNWKWVGTEVGSGSFASRSLRIPFHIRSMRKLAMNMDLTLAVHNFSAVGVKVALGGNVLLMK